MGRPNPESEVCKGPQRRERFQGGESAEGIANVLSVSRLTLSSKDKRLCSFILKASSQTSWWGDDNIDPLAGCEMPLLVVTQRDYGLTLASARPFPPVEGAVSWSHCASEPLASRYLL